MKTGLSKDYENRIIKYIYPNAMKIGLYLHSFTVALFTTVKTQKQPKCPSVGKWIKKIWHICTMDYYSAFRKGNYFCHLQQHGWTPKTSC